MPTSLAVLLSGSGSTLQNLIDRIEAGTLDARVACVVSSRDGVLGLERAARHGIPTATVLRKAHPDTAAFSAAVWDAIGAHGGADLVALAGFMSLLCVPPAYHNRIMNVHPSLIPSFCGQGMYGHHVHEAVLRYGAKVSGATVHFVDEQYDNGPIILQEAVPVLEEDTPETLAARVQATEREIYPRAIQLFAEGRLRVHGRQVRVLPAPRC
jgi:formyltetrahydrofolate-dependent phosphoribosylglycinamide formyltransferase